MSTAAEHRVSFLKKVGSYVRQDEVNRFAVALDDFVAWSDATAGKVVFSGRDYDQKTVSFEDVASGRVFWTAYPRVESGAKLEILPGGAHCLSQEVRAHALDILRSISREPVGDDTTLRVPFTALKGAAARHKVKDLMNTLLVHLNDNDEPSSSPNDPVLQR